MPLTEEQKRIYASAPSGEYVRDTLTLSHPSFSQTYYLTNWPEPFSGMVNDALVEFQVFPFKIVLPDDDGRGQQDMRLVLSNAIPDIVNELEATQDGNPTPITVEYRSYLTGDVNSTLDPPITLYLSRVMLDLDQVSGIATRANVINAPFPRVVYRISEFPGLQT